MAVDIQDEGIRVRQYSNFINFVGAGVTATADGKVTIPGGGTGPAGPAGPAGPSGDTTIKVMTANGTLSGPSVKVTGGTAFTLRTDYNIQNILNKTTSAITISAPSGYTLVGSGNVASSANVVFQRLDGVTQYQRLSP